jgi:hypothetical protein
MNESKHAAATKSGMTSKNLTKNEEKMYARTDELVDSVRGMDQLLGKLILALAEWRDDKSGFRDAIQNVKIMLALN